MTEPKSSKPSVFVSIQWLLIVGFTTILTLVLAGIFYWFYNYATQRAIDQVTLDLTQTLQTVALEIDGDELLALYKDGKPNAAGIAWQEAKISEAARKIASEKFGAPNTGGFSDDPRYQKMLNWADAIHQIEPQAWPYVWVNGKSEYELIYLVDLGARYNPEKSTLFFESLEDSMLITELTLSTNENGKLESYVDEWGEWYSAWMPIKDSSGKIIGGVGIDFVAGEVDEVQQTIRNIILAAFGLTYLIMFLGIYTISSIITRPILALTQAADAVGEGNYNQDFASLFGGKVLHNEVGILARVFSVMVEKVQNRVEKLQEQVAKLRIEIDHSKRQEDVKGIVDTDFFRELQDKAKAVRDKRNSQDTE